MTHNTSLRFDWVKRVCDPTACWRPKVSCWLWEVGPWVSLNVTNTLSVAEESMLALEQRGLVFCAVARMQAEITRRPASCWCFMCMTMWREGSWMQRSVWQSDNRNVTSLRCVSVAAQFSLYCFWLQVVLSASAARPCYTAVQEGGNERVTGATHLTWLHLSVWSGESEEEDLCPSHVCWDSADTQILMQV